MTIKKEGIPHDSAPVPINFPEFKQSGTVHSFQFAVRDADGNIAVPAAGVVTVKVRTPSAAAFEDVPNNAFGLTSRGNWIQPLIGVHIEAVELSLSELDVGKTLDVVISSSFGGA